MNASRAGWYRVVLGLMLVLGAGCGSEPDVFAELRLSSVGLEFPHTKERLEACRSADERACLLVFERVREAKRALFEDGSARAMRRTLDALIARCTPGATPKEGCAGAATALYFFDGADEDRSLRQFFSDERPDLLMPALRAQPLWLQTRSDKSPWREWIDSRELSDSDRTYALDVLDLAPPDDLSIADL